jgi:predicted DNA-binding transcriptional regulator AlpA
MARARLKVSIPTEEFLTSRDLAERLKVSIRTIERLRSTDREFPKPILIGKGLKPRVRWRWSEVEAWLTKQQQ